MFLILLSLGYLYWAMSNANIIMNFLYPIRRNKCISFTEFVVWFFLPHVLQLALL